MTTARSHARQNCNRWMQSMSSKLSFLAYYLTVLVYTKTIILLSVASRLGKWSLPLAASTSVNNCCILLFLVFFSVFLLYCTKFIIVMLVCIINVFVKPI